MFGARDSCVFRLSERRRHALDSRPNKYLHLDTALIYRPITACGMRSGHRFAMNQWRMWRGAARTRRRHNKSCTTTTLAFNTISDPRERYIMDAVPCTINTHHAASGGGVLQEARGRGEGGGRRDARLAICQGLTEAVTRPKTTSLEAAQDRNPVPSTPASCLRVRARSPPPRS